MFDLFEKTSANCSKIVTQQYSTSFSLGIKTLDKKYREPIYGIYGMVRYADEIVDTFHNYDKNYLLDKFKRDTFEAIGQKISLNPILFSFQKAVNEYDIPLDLVEAFFKSMEMDLSEVKYSETIYQEYIYGSAEVVGLMCLKVFTGGDTELYESLKAPARALGAAFQKVNFLRDMKSDFQDRGRIYFPGINFEDFDRQTKQQIEKEIAADFHDAYLGITRLPRGARLGVLLAYKYYQRLLNKIRNTPASQITEARVRVPDFQKVSMLIQTLLKQQLSIILYPHA